MNRLQLHCASWAALAALALPSHAASRLYVVAGSTLNELDPTTAAIIGSTTITAAAGSIGTIGALAYDVASDTLFLSSTGNDNLWTLNYTTGVATLVGLYNVGTTVVMHGLAVDDTGQLYGYSSGVASGARFFSINRTTGQATPISDPGATGFGSLEFVASTQTMYLADLTADSLLTIDRVTGATTLVGPFGVAGAVGIGLAYDATLGMYACNNSTNVGLFMINLTTGAATLVGPLTSNPIALTFISDPNTPTTSFCFGDGTGTACPCANTGAAGNGCGSMTFPGGANLTSTGIAGASIGTDTLVLTASDIPGPGLFFQASGLAVVPINFGDGHLCASAEIIRMGIVFPDVFGVASYPGGLTPNPIHIAGGPISATDTKYYQCWYRSVPGLCGAGNFNLTQGLTLTWGP